MSQGIAYIFLKTCRTTESDLTYLRASIASARRGTCLPICLCADSSLEIEFRPLVDDYVVSDNRGGHAAMRIMMSEWVPFDEWLYLDHDALVIGDSISFGFSVLERGFDVALCSIVCEADKCCFGDSARYKDVLSARPDIPFFAFYPQLGVAYHRRSHSLRAFEKAWLRTHVDLLPSSTKLQPSFAVTYYEVGARLRLYHLSPHFNCRKRFREMVDGVELPTTYFPRTGVQIMHDKEWSVLP